MGSEIRWHLRFSKARQIEVLIKPEYESELREALVLEPGWSMQADMRDGLLKALLTRNKP